MSQINLTSPVTFTTAMLIADVVTQAGGSVDAVPQLTQVGTQAASIALEIQSTLGAFLLPRVTTTQMNNMTAGSTGVNGMLVYNTTTGAFYGYIGGAWTALVDVAGATFSGNIILPLNGSSGNSFNIQFNNGVTTTYISNNSGSFFIDAAGTNITLQTGSNATALTLDTSQNATFTANVNLKGSGNLILGSDNSGGSTFSPELVIYESSSKYMYAAMNLSSDNAAHIATVGAPLTIATAVGNSLALNSGNTITFGTSGSTLALTLDASQNATFAGTVKSGNITLSTSNINSSGSLVFGKSGSTKCVSKRCVRGYC
jgi:hypothetical protein